MTNANDESTGSARRLPYTAGYSQPLSPAFALVRSVACGCVRPASSHTVYPPFSYAAKKYSRTNGTPRVYALGVAECYDSGRNHLRSGRSIGIGER